MEYLGAVLVVLYEWVRTRRRPGGVTLGGMVVAIGGLALVLNPGDLVGADPRGVAWALFAATGMAVYFITSANTSGVPRWRSWPRGWVWVRWRCSCSG